MHASVLKNFFYSLALFFSSPLPSSLLAVALDNFIVKVIDLETRTAIRTFPSHNSKITDMALSPDARWLIVSSMDKAIRTWDLPRGQLVDKFLVASPCISLSMSPTGEYLATAHTQDLGIYLWSNMSLYAPINLRPLPQDFEAGVLEMPCVRADELDQQVEEEDEENSDSEDTAELVLDQMETDGVYKSPEQLSDELVTLSTLPVSRWKNLLHLDLIKVRCFVERSLISRLMSFIHF